MGRLFGYDSNLWGILSGIFDYALLHILGVVCSIPLVTAGAALTAVQSLCAEMHGERYPSIIRDFFSEFRRSLKPAAGLWCVCLLVIAWQILCLRIAAMMPLPMGVCVRAAALSVLLIIGCTVLWLFSPEICMCQKSFLEKIRFALEYALHYLPFSAAMLCICLIPFILICIVPQSTALVAVFWLFGGTTFLLGMAGRIAAFVRTKE